MTQHSLQPPITSSSSFSLSFLLHKNENKKFPPKSQQQQLSSSLPTEILCFIFAYLQHYRSDLAVCSRVCRQWFLPSILQLYKSPWFCTKRVTESFARTVHQASVRAESGLNKTGETAPLGISVNELVRIVNLEHEACEKYLWDEAQVLVVLQACKNITHLRLGGLGRRPIWYSPSRRIFDLAAQRQSLRVIQYNDNCEVASTGMRRVLFLIANLPNLSKLSVYGEVQDAVNDEYFVTKMARDEQDLWNPSVALPGFPNEHTALDSISFKTEWFDERFVVALLRHLPNLTHVRFGSLTHQPSFLGLNSIKSLVKNCKKVKSLKLVLTELAQPDLPEIARLVARAYGGQLEKFRLVVDGLVENALELTDEPLEPGAPLGWATLAGHIGAALAEQGGAAPTGTTATIAPFPFVNMASFGNFENDDFAWSNGFYHMVGPAETLDMENAFAELWDAIGGKLICLYLGGSWFTPSIVRSLTLSLARANNPDGLSTDFEDPVESASSCLPSYKGPLRHLYLYAPGLQPRDVAQFDAESVRLISLVGSDLRKLVLDGTRNFFGNDVGRAIASSCRSLLNLTLISTSMNSDTILHVLENVGSQLDQLVLMSDFSLTPSVAKSIPANCPQLGSLNWISTSDMVYHGSEDAPRPAAVQMCDEDVLLDILRHLGPKRLRAFLFSDYPVTPRLLQGVQRYAKRLEELWLRLPGDDVPGHTAKENGVDPSVEHASDPFLAPETSTRHAEEELSGPTLPSLSPSTFPSSSSSSTSLSSSFPYANPASNYASEPRTNHFIDPDPPLHWSSSALHAPAPLPCPALSTSHASSSVSRPSYSNAPASSLPARIENITLRDGRQTEGDEKETAEEPPDQDDGLWNGKLVELEKARRRVMESCRYLDVFYL